MIRKIKNWFAYLKVGFQKANEEKRIADAIIKQKEDSVIDRIRELEKRYKLIEQSCAVLEQREATSYTEFNELKNFLLTEEQRKIFEDKMNKIKYPWHKNRGNAG